MLHEGWHTLNLYGHSYGEIGSSSFYYIESNNFWAHDKTGLMPVDGLPLIHGRYWIDGTTPQTNISN